MTPWNDETEQGKTGPLKPNPADPAPRPLQSPRRSQFGLRHLMLLSVYFAIIFAAIARAYNSGNEVDAIIAVIAIGLGLVGGGLLLSTRLVRWTGVGWLVCFVGMTMMSVVLVGYLTVFIVPVMIFVVVNVVARRRATQQDALLWVLALAADRQRPLGPAVAALARQSRGVYRLRALRVADCLDRGMTLPDALDFVSKSATASARVLVRVGYDSGTLAEALRDAAMSRSVRPPGWQALGSRLGYLCLVVAVMQSVISFIMYFILPKFEAIFKDFGIAIPELTRATIVVSHWVTAGWVFPAFTMAELLILIYLPYAFAGYANLHIPLLDRFFARRHSVLILRCLAMSVEGDRPITAVLDSLSAWYPTRWVRRRLAGVLQATLAGHDWSEALRAYGLISRSDLALLDSARRAGNLPWALRELAVGSARRLNYRLQFVSQILVTLAMLAVGALVGLFVVAYFIPLTYLIERLAR